MDNTNDRPNLTREESRRKFLKDIGLVGLGGFAVGAALFSAKKFEDVKKGQNIRLLTADGNVVEVDSIHIKSIDKDLLTLQQERGREGIAGRSWVMVIDLSKCRNARKCISACQEAHHLRPDQYHINTLQMQDTPRTQPYHLPKPCQHCDNPPCVSVCPVDATFKRNDGPVLIDNERCIGCRFCIAACPYSARSFNWFEPKDAELFAETVYDVELNVPQKKGTITKCLLSADKLRKGELPYCVSACPNGVFYFGDANEDAVTNGTTKETVRLSQLLTDNAAYQLYPELGTKPRIFFLPPKNRLFPFTENEETKV
jgi:molybdopterin-containing oxidoreductase family iron-sulfur binding subunit